MRCSMQWAWCCCGGCSRAPGVRGNGCLPSLLSLLAIDARILVPLAAACNGMSAPRPAARRLRLWLHRAAARARPDRRAWQRWCSSAKLVWEHWHGSAAVRGDRWQRGHRRASLWRRRWIRRPACVMTVILRTDEERFRVSGPGFAVGGHAGGAGRAAIASWPRPSPRRRPCWATTCGNWCSEGRRSCSMKRSRSSRRCWRPASRPGATGSRLGGARSGRGLRPQPG